MNKDTLSISEVARFFGKSVQWVRWREQNGGFTYPNGEKIVPRRTHPEKNATGYRRYTLEDIESMAESLYRLEKISEQNYNSIVARVRVFQD
jgi:hypothetical protein